MLHPGTPDEVGLSADGLARVDAAVQEQIDQGVVAGAVTLTARDGKLVRTSIMGVDDPATGKPLALDSIFRIFSMTKPVTGVAMSILLDEGLWSPEDPIAKHLPEFGDVRVYAGTADDGSALTEAPDHPPTMAELMTHTAGFSYGWEPDELVDRLYASAEVLQAPSVDEFVKRLATVPLAYQPGTKWVYSLSVDLQGAIVERLSGMSLADFFEQKIFRPLGMVDTAFHTPPEKRDRLVSVRYTGEGASLAPIANPLLPDFDAKPSMSSGGAGLVSTVTDYARFAQLLLNGGEWNGQRIVSSQSLKLQMTNHVSDEIIAGGFGVGQHRIRPGFGFGFDGVVFYDPALAGIPVGTGTYMWDGAAGTWFWVDPENDLLYVGLIQLFSATAPPLQATTQKLMADAIVRPGRAV